MGLQTDGTEKKLKGRGRRSWEREAKMKEKGVDTGGRMEGPELIGDDLLGCRPGTAGASVQRYVDQTVPRWNRRMEEESREVRKGAAAD